MKKIPDNQIVIYEAENGKTHIEVRFENENVWLTQKLIAELFGCSIDNVSLHLKNIFSEHELDPRAVTEEYSITGRHLGTSETLGDGPEIYCHGSPK